ncbi:hypothetical protein Phi17:1_gp6 [Cellulophaga phage phi17:1]|uniref:Uncharacterized protein n=1 Tax=Cellulophaga phage phi17:1 TaxID=1327980 RepID=S0A1C7_9CAUD|nr:hypothetical protein Phi17:1_gp6 [Cellulophaga phage phi17:1]AGO48282.1 hypothetical protein Phi17:1_gp6 [Cellulophaga phage phi17:1]
MLGIFKIMNKIIANKSILENTSLNCIFIATKATEETQCLGNNRNHIQWVGDLDIPVPDVAVLIMELYDEIKHGDDEHKLWLKEKMQEFIDRKCV